MLAYDEPCGEVLRHAGVGRVQVEAGSWVSSLGLCLPTSPGLHAFLISFSLHV